MTEGDTETKCCSRLCITRTQSSLKGSVSFCSIGCVLVMKFGGEARIHETFITHKFFLEIPPRDGLIRLLTYFLKSLTPQLRKTS